MRDRYSIPYDGLRARVAVFRGAGRPWDLQWAEGSSAGGCLFADVLAHWKDRDQFANDQLVGLIEAEYPPGSAERTELEAVGRLRPQLFLRRD